jgi:2-polyprenyl-3-methyl-5-hydroxy-6-metoxy-1,4-benzoquinol methylase
MNPAFYFSLEKERKRYQDHNNDIYDSGYQNFVSPIVNGVLLNFNTEDKGLDFGCGTGPVITKLLRDKNYNIATYDPFFDNNLNALKNAYNFIVCCEVMEHFHNPLKEFHLLKSILKPSGKLYCMTHLYNENINFENWYYKNDETHVIFYQQETIQWIASTIGFSNFKIDNRLIVFEN